MQIYGPFRLSTTQASTAAKSTQASTPGANRLAAQPTGQKPSAGPIDQLDLSSAARASETSPTNRLQESGAIAGGGDIRIDRVAELRRQIADGSYDTNEKMDLALDRMLDDLV
ncbi:negative regulator of flagellin synthesis FlgM [Neorhodopirellula lusitana]|uniref:Negative regulator of flagellin synthesis FlgM n=1 Tax=Neorhodopirellula lusitana TaxID=445327 RepID=A0ABY1PN23_9BACT|nr:flagellar biosynthesis anti-sigma factor FlgM [Neorhodopirellula lusitana]SMP37812.1 negative regulator of flagellin synthesis FlgM [Neorhodopirellula lusitana]